MNFKGYIGYIFLLTFTYIVIYFIYIRNEEDGIQKPNAYAKILNKQVTVDNVSKVSSIQQNKTKLTKYILYWTKMFGREDFYYGLGYEPFQKCEYKNCFTTSNKNYMDIRNYNAIMFHGPLYDFKKNGKPSARSDHQRYVFANLESPGNFNKNLNYANGFYNWTMTYRMDSDIPNPYGFYVKSKINYTAPSRDQLKSKKSLIAWFVSHCKASSKRAELVKSIMQYTPVDIYGHCGTLNCSRKNGHCYTLLENNYKFYLSFENSYCKDYVTEKFFNIHNISVVPVVYGRANYKEIAPPHSFINIEDFSSVKELFLGIKFAFMMANRKDVWKITPRSLTRPSDFKVRRLM
ncbi:alpha-(1,3)-fucosyltransferase C-like isoform X2 [Agrilus planipennis]|uniref:Fucosyltransferase n=1 Tax=Agrilus planipennis TaxID=224129 RepID=A0A7F5RB48_AGRPL|nr:alpha-(1,3)-fucosyltransferase C-like isoform X2 [Agrilus planipennis]